MLPARAVDNAVLWSAPAERSVPTSRDFGRPGRPGAPAAARAKAVSRSACHRTPKPPFGRRLYAGRGASGPGHLRHCAGGHQCGVCYRRAVARPHLGRRGPLAPGQPGLRQDTHRPQERGRAVRFPGRRFQMRRPNHGHQHGPFLRFRRGIGFLCLQRRHQRQRALGRHPGGLLPVDAANGSQQVPGPGFGPLRQPQSPGRHHPNPGDPIAHERCRERRLRVFRRHRMAPDVGHQRRGHQSAGRGPDSHSTVSASKPEALELVVPLITQTRTTNSLQGVSSTPGASGGP